MVIVTIWRSLSVSTVKVINNCWTAVLLITALVTVFHGFLMWLSQIDIYIYIMLYIIYCYIYIISCYHENNVPSWLPPQWLCGNSSTWAHDVWYIYIYYILVLLCNNKQPIFHHIYWICYETIMYNVMIIFNRVQCYDDDYLQKSQ